jgi:predicted kinase
MPSRSQLVIFTGLPGTGKSTLADEAVTILGCPAFAKDQLEAALRRSNIGADAGSGWATYELLTVLATEQLRRGQSAILDSVATFERIRARWRALAQEHGSRLRIIECVCSDEALHRARLATRQRGIPDWPELSWDDVLDVRARYVPWSDPRLILDAARPFETNRASLRDYLLAARTM